MNVFEWKTVKRIAFDHPYFDFAEHSISEIEAQKIMSKGFNSAEEFMKGVYGECNICEHADEHSEAQYKIKLKKPLLSFAAAVILIITIFLAFTPAGRALASDIYNAIVRLIDETLTIQQIEPSGFGKDSLISANGSYNTLKEVASSTEHPIVYCDSADIELDNIVIEVVDKNMTIIRSKYNCMNKFTFIITQTLHTSNARWSGAVSATDNIVSQVSLKNDITIYIGEMEDGTVFAEGYGKNIDINISGSECDTQEMYHIVSTLDFYD